MTPPTWLDASPQEVYINSILGLAMVGLLCASCVSTQTPKQLAERDCRCRAALSRTRRPAAQATRLAELRRLLELALRLLDEGRTS